MLARFGDRVAGTYAAEDVLPRTAHVVGEATGAERVDVWLHTNDTWRVGASWTSETTPDETSAAPAPVEGATSSTDAGPGVLEPHPGAVEIRHRGELLGAISVTKSAGRTPDPGRGEAC